MHGSRGPVTRIIRTNNNVYPSQRVITTTSGEECIDMEKSCSDHCQIIEAPTLQSSSCRHHQWFETKWVYSYNCCRCLGDFVSLPVWLVVLAGLALLTFLILSIVFGVLFALNRPTSGSSNTPVTTPAPTSCFNTGVYNYYYQRCDCPESTCGEFCENCNLNSHISEFLFILFSIFFCIPND